MKASLIATGVVIGLIISIQINSDLISSRDTNISEKEDYAKVIQILEIEQNKLMQELSSLREEELEKSKLLSTNIQAELEESNKIAGFTKISGPGTIIRLVDPQDENSTPELISTLRQILNLLFSMNSEAVSVNGYRVVFKTPIVSVGKSTLLNNFHISPPYEINVIGNSEFILSALKTKESMRELRERDKNNEIQVEFQVSNNLEIPAYIY